MHWAETLHPEKQNQILRYDFSEKQVATILYLLADESRMQKNGKFFWHWEIDSLENYQKCFFLL